MRSSSMSLTTWEVETPSAGSAGAIVCADGEACAAALTAVPDLAAWSFPTGARRDGTCGLPGACPRSAGAPESVGGTATGRTTRGPGSRDSKPRPRALRFSTFSFSAAPAACPAKFSAAEVVICLPLRSHHLYIDTDQSNISTTIYVSSGLVHDRWVFSRSVLGGGFSGGCGWRADDSWFRARSRCAHCVLSGWSCGRRL